jgi:hypothetical protein
MAVQSVMVEDAPGLNDWQRVGTVEEEQAELATRFAREAMTPALLEIQAAIGRLLERRAVARAAATTAVEGA